jgi:hypothetical protein
MKGSMLRLFFLQYLYLTYTYTILRKKWTKKKQGLIKLSIILKYYAKKSAMIQITTLHYFN